MRIRHATHADIPAIADISVACFGHNDELYAFTNPYRHAYPDSFRRYFVARTKARLCTPGSVVLVAVTDRNGRDRVEDKIAGFAVYERKATKGDVDHEEIASRWMRDSVWNALDRSLLNIEEHYTAICRLDQSVSSEAVNLWRSHSDDKFSDIPSMWNLRNLCTDPAYQRRGIGSLLIQWGKEQATREHVPIGLGSSQAGARLYEREGFRLYDTMDVKGIPIGKIPVYLWEPEAIMGKFQTKLMQER